MATTAGKHRRTNTFSMAMDNGPTSTTKALLVSVVAPRKFFTKVVKEQESTSTTTLSPSTSAEKLQAVVQQNQENAKTVKESKSKNNLMGKKSNNDEKKKSSNDGDTAATTADSITNSSDHSNHSKEKSKSNNKVDAANTSDNITNSSDHSNLSKATTATSNRDDNEEEVTAEEAAAVVSTDQDDEQEVNVEELLRIAMQTLLEEWHLLNVPTYSQVMDKQSIVKKVSLHNLFSNQSVKIREVTSFIQMQCMARPASLGIILERLERIGVGSQVGTVCIYKAELCKTASPYAHLPQEDDEDDDIQEQDTGDEDEDDKDTPDSSNHNENSNKTLSEEEQERLKEERMIQEARMEWKNAATRLRIEQVREQIVEQAAFSFDFIALLATASILAGIGLITNNTVVIVASMLVSPIMGPVLGLTFGSRIKDWPLVKISLKHEVYALMGCVVIGAFIGLAAGFTKLATETWPTTEMQSRGEWTGLLTGIAVAVPSGMGVCLSILGGNTSSLVGVAISASLLPPAVNAGVCLLYSILVKTDAVISDSGLDAADFALIGGVSFALTAINIICIWVAGFIMFEIKEVAPTKEKSAFWAKDIKEAREMNTKGERHINVGVLRNGLKAALRRKSEKPVETINIVPPKQKPGSYRTESVGTAFALRPTTHPVAGAAVASYTVLSEESQEQNNVHVTDDNVRYVGLEDMATLLGFDQEDEDDAIDHAAVATRLGRGRYL